MRRGILIVWLLLLLGSPSLALPPEEAGRGFRDGANHHLGDASFTARFGRTPDSADDEKLRMRVQLEYVRDLLAARPATSPDRQARRMEILGYLDEYIAAGVTPKNSYVSWRNPVFVDA